MKPRGIQRWIIRHPDGQLVYYPWSWDNVGAMTAYVVDTPSVMRTTLRRQRFALRVLLPLAGIGLLVRFNPLLALGVDLLLLWLFGQWMMRDLRGNSVKLPRRLAVELTATRRHDPDGIVPQMGIILLFTCAIILMSLKPGMPLWLLIGGAVLTGFTLVNLWVALTIRRLKEQPDAGKTVLPVNRPPPVE